MKKNKLAIVTLATLTLVSNVVAAPGSVNVALNNQKITLTDAAPYMEGGRTYVPIRVVSENLGAKVNWASETETFSVITDKTEISGKVDSPTVSVNKKDQKLDSQSDDVVVTMKGGRVYVPLRFFSEALGYNVTYDATGQVVYINDKDVPVELITPTNKLSPSDGKVIYKTGMNPREFCKLVVDKLENSELSYERDRVFCNNSSAGILGTSPYDESEVDYDMEVYFFGWNTSKSDKNPELVEEYALAMEYVGKILTFYTVDAKKVYDEVDKAFQEGKEGHIIKTSDGRTFRVSIEDREILIR